MRTFLCRLLYLRQGLKDGPVRHIIEGLSGTMSNYHDSITMLQARYDRPRLLHQAHVHMVVQVPSLKSGSGKELCRLHDFSAQHLETLKVMKYEPGPFVTSLIQMKLDQATAFEWQRYIQGISKVSHHK